MSISKHTSELVLIFNASNQLLVQQDANGRLQSVENLDFLKSYDFVSVKIAEQKYIIKIIL